MNNKPISELQLKILEIFKAVATICEENNIRYFAIGGTCLGAVRHKGFIPWDDDLDIAIPINDYFRFIEIAQKQLPGNLDLYFPTFHYYLFLKVHDKNTAFIESDDISCTNRYKGIYIDIMPLSGLPAGSMASRFFYKQVKFYKILNGLRKIPLAQSNTSKHKKVIMYLIKPFLMLFPHNFFASVWMNVLRKNDFDKSNFVVFGWSKNVEKYTFDKKAFEDHIYLDFEDTKIRCPKGWHEYLTNHFGDYMTLPPKEQQIQCHTGIIDLKRSYKEYQNNRELTTAKQSEPS